MPTPPKQSQKNAASTAAEKTASPASKTLTMGPTHEQIAKRAYEIYQARGGAHGRQDDDWKQAERELKLGRQ